MSSTVWYAYVLLWMENVISNAFINSNIKACFLFWIMALTRCQNSQKYVLQGIELNESISYLHSDCLKTRKRIGHMMQNTITPAPVKYSWKICGKHDDVIKWKPFPLTGPFCGEFTGPDGFPAQRPVTRRFDVFFGLRPNKRLSKQPWGWWFETPSWSLWRQYNDL